MDASTTSNCCAACLLAPACVACAATAVAVTTRTPHMTSLSMGHSTSWLSATCVCCYSANLAPHPAPEVRDLGAAQWLRCSADAAEDRDRLLGEHRKDFGQGKCGAERVSLRAPDEHAPQRVTLQQGRDQ